MGFQENLNSLVQAINNRAKLSDIKPVDAVPTDGSSNPVSSNGVFDALAVKAPLASPQLTGSPSVNGVSFSGYSGFKNHIINGNFDIWQRGTSFPITAISNTYTADRMYVTLNQITSGTLIVAQNTAQKDTNANYCLELNASALSSTSGINVTQIIESLNAKKLAGKTVTLSLKAKVLSGTANCSMQVIEGTNIDWFPIGGAITSNNITLTTSYQTFTLKINVASATTSIAFRFNTPNAFNGVVYIQNIQLEEGSVATPFEQRPYGLELSLCRRYYEKTWDGSINTLGARFAAQQANTTLLGTTQFSVGKRVPPSVTIYSPSGTVGAVWTGASDTDTGAGATAMHINTQGFRCISFTAPVGTGPLYTFHFTASAEL